MITTSVSPYPAALHQLVSGNKWAEATRLCRFVKDDTLWACLGTFLIFIDVVISSGIFIYPTITLIYHLLLTFFVFLAGMSTHAKHLETAEVAYSAIMEADKVHYIQYIRELPIKEVRNAEMAVLTGNMNFHIY